MKKISLLLAIVGFGTIVGFSTINTNNYVEVRAEDEIVDPIAECTVEIEKIKNGTITASIVEGKEGDICELDIKANLFYLIESVKVNDVTLTEDENISGLYKFALVKGINKVVVKIVINESLLGELSTIYEQAKNKDWTNLFTVENVIHLIKWVLDCGILIAIIRYYIRDKRLANKVEKATKDSIEKIIPTATKETVIATVNEVLAPIFSQLKADNVELTKAMTVFAKCMALAQEDTPESRTAIIDMLSHLQISDQKTLNEVKAYIDKLFADHISTINGVIETLNEIKEENAKNIEEDSQTQEIDGTSI